MKLLLSLALLFSFSTTGLAAKKEYTVGVEGILFLPYSNVQNKVYEGTFKKILDKFAKQNNIVFKYVPLPITRLYTEFLAGGLDFKIPANPIWQSTAKKERKVQVIYSDPVLDFIDGVFVKSSLELSDLKKLGVVAGFTTFEYNHLIESGKIKKTENQDIAGLIRQVILGRVDAAYINIAVGNYYLKEQLGKPGAVKFAPNLPHTKGNYHLATIKHAEVIKSFNIFLKKESKFIQQIKAPIQLK